MANDVRRDIEWLQAFLNLYEKASPLIRHITNLERLKAGELPVSPAVLVESKLTLLPVLSALGKMRKPRKSGLAGLKEQFKTVLVHCIRAADHAERYLNYAGNVDRHALLGMMINAMVLASEYNTSLSARMDALTDDAVLPGV